MCPAGRGMALFVPFRNLVFTGEITMEINARLIITAVFVFVGGLGACYMTGKHNQRMIQQIEEIENAGQVDWNPETGSSLLQEGESHLAESRELLQAGSFEEAQYADDRFLRVFDPYIYAYGDQALPNGIALTEWVEQQKSEHAERVRHTYRNTLEALRQGLTTHDRMIAPKCKGKTSTDLLCSQRLGRPAYAGRWRARRDTAWSNAAVSALQREAGSSRWRPQGPAG